MTHTTEGTEEVIKTDVLGRQRTSAARREKLLGEFDQSGLSAKQYAELIGIKYQTLATWLQKRRQQAKLPMKPGGAGEVAGGRRGVGGRPPVWCGAGIGVARRGADGSGR
jgi:hypothetical protein